MRAGTPRREDELWPQPTVKGPRKASGSVTVTGFGPLDEPLPPRVPWTGGTAAALVDELQARMEGSADLLDRAVILVDGSKADREVTVEAGSHVEFLPPISGG